MEALNGSLIVRSVTDNTIGVRWISIEGSDGYNLQAINVNTYNVITYDDNLFPNNEQLIEGLVSGAVYEIQLRGVRINGGDRIQVTLSEILNVTPTG